MNRRTVKVGLVVVRGHGKIPRMFHPSETGQVQRLVIYKNDQAAWSGIKALNNCFDSGSAERVIVPRHPPDVPCLARIVTPKPKPQFIVERRLGRVRSSFSGQCYSRVVTIREPDTTKVVIGTGC